MVQIDFNKAMRYSSEEVETTETSTQAETDAAAQALLDAAAQEAEAKKTTDEAAATAAAEEQATTEAAASEGKEAELSLLDKLKAIATTETTEAQPANTEAAATTTTTEAKVEPELSEDQKILLKLKESGLTILDLAKSIQITDYSKMSTEDLIRINLEKQFGENGVTAEILEKETLGFENLLPSQQTAYLNNIKTTLGQEINYGNEVAKYLDEVLASKPNNQAPIITPEQEEKQRLAIIEAETKEDLAALTATIEKLGIAPDSEIATSLLSQYSYERAVGYVKNGKLDAVTFLDHAYKIQNYDNVADEAYKRGVKEATEKLSGTGASTATSTAPPTKSMKEQIAENLKMKHN